MDYSGLRFLKCEVDTAGYILEQESVYRIQSKGVCFVNYPTFLKKVDSTAACCDIESLRAFVHEIARTLPEEKRERFLCDLCSLSNSPNETEDHFTKDEEDFAKKIDASLMKIEEIRNEERSIDSEYSEEYYDWDDYDEHFEFSDPEHVLDDIEEAIALLDKAVDREEYEKGFVLAAALSSLSVLVDGDYDEQKMTMNELFYRDLLFENKDDLLKSSVYLAYMANDENTRAEAMVTMMENLGNFSVSLEEILESADDEIDLPSLLPSWIEALAGRNSKAVDELLEEALNMVDDQSLILDTASRYASTHPSIYLSVMKGGLDNTSASQMLETGLKAMKEVPEESKTRSEISLLTAGYALKCGKKLTAEECWFEAYRSLKTVENFLRLRLLSDNWNMCSQRVRTLYTDSLKSRWNQKPYAALMFFDARFDEVIDMFMNVKEGLGWSSTFMKEGIALFLMLLSNGAEGKGITDMRKRAFNAVSFKSEDYTLGTNIECDSSDYDMFLNVFDKWKALISLDEARCSEWITKMEKWVEMRVDAIMSANKRNYYDECASFVAALAEVEESRGKKGAKEDIMQSYKSLYPRRRAFINELVHYGMRNL